MPNERKIYVQNVVYLVEGLVLVIVLGNRHVGHGLEVRVPHERRQAGHPDKGIYRGAVLYAREITKRVNVREREREKREREREREIEIDR